MRSPCGRDAAPTPVAELGGRSHTCWRVDMAIHVPGRVLHEGQRALALRRGVRLDADGRLCQASVSVSADDVALAARVALGRWAHLAEELGLDDDPVVELHVSRVDASSIDLRPLAVVQSTAP